MKTVKKLVGAGTQFMDSSYDDCFTEIDCTSGNMNLFLPASGSIQVGWNTTLYKTDPTSNVIQIRPQGGDKLNYFWEAADPYCLYLNLTQSAGEVIYGGGGRFHLMGKSYHRDMPQSQRTITTPNYNVLPKDRWETIRCNPSVSGQAIGLYFNPVNHFTKGGYLSCNVWVEKVDISPLPVVIIPYSGDSLNGVPDQTYSLTNFGKTHVYIASDGLWVK